MWSNTSTPKHTLGWDVVQVWRMGVRSQEGLFPLPLAVEVAPLRVCTSIYLCYWPAGNILQLLISPGAENEGYRVVFSLLQCFLHLSLVICGCPIPVQAAFHSLFYLPKAPDTRRREALSAVWATSPARRDGPRSETRSDKANARQELTADEAAGGEKLGYPQW